MDDQDKPQPDGFDRHPLKPTADALRRHLAKPRELKVYSNEHWVGTLSENQDIWTFTYSPPWISKADAWDLTPDLRRADGVITDGSTHRPVQWFFDNLLPEETMRTAVAKDAKIDEADAFGLLTYLGRESAGSLLLLPPGEEPDLSEQWEPLSLADLSARILNMPKVAIATTGRKRMSIAGAQQKLLVGWDGKSLSEPIGHTPSTHILKPDNNSGYYPHSVINEYAMMRLAKSLDLSVPEVWRIYSPQPVYIVQRFDRRAKDGRIQRLHIIDACQLSGYARSFKVSMASLATLDMLARLTRSRVMSTMQLWRWLIFNLLIGNDDNHLKNISFLVDGEGVQIAPAYDLLSTAVYTTKAYGLDQAWPQVDLTIAFPETPRFADVTNARLMRAAELIGVRPQVAQRELEELCRKIGPAMEKIIDDIETKNKALPAETKPYTGGEMRLLRAIRHVVIEDMVKRVAQ
jgi:serine/threonine-protein kinase HipA